jgi:hypothetical protein
MQKWEYQIIEVIKGEVEAVNGKLLSKTAIKGLAGGERYKLSEYLADIGNDGWEVVGEGSIALLVLRSYVPGSSQSGIIAKRPKE